MTVVEARAGRPKRDLVAVAEHHLAADPLAVDVRAVERAEIAQDHAPVPLLEDAVLLRDDLVEELDRVVRVTPEAVDGSKLDRLLSFGGRKNESSHRSPRDGTRDSPSRKAPNGLAFRHPHDG